MKTLATIKSEETGDNSIEYGLDPNNGERRRLKRHRHDEKLDLVEVELERETAYLEENEKITEKSMLKAKRKHENSYKNIGAAQRVCKAMRNSGSKHRGMTGRHGA